MKMHERIKMRSVSFSDEAPAPILPPRNHRGTSGGTIGTYRRQTSAESLPLYESDPIYGNTAGLEPNHGLNSLPRIMPHHRRKMLEFNRPSSSLAGHYGFIGTENSANTAPDYANLTSISRRGAGYYNNGGANLRAKDDYSSGNTAYNGALKSIRH